MRTLRALFAVAVLALVATGCFRSDISVQVNDDGSGTVSAVFAVNPKQYAELYKSLGSDADEELGDDPCKELQNDAQDGGDLPNGTKVEAYKDGDFCGVKFTIPFTAGDDIDKSIADAFGGLESAGVGGFETFTIEKQGTGWRFQAKPASDSSSTGTDMAMFEQYFKGASNVVRIKLPGRQVEHNADRIDGDGTMIWNLNVLGDSRTLSARTEPGEPKRNETLTDAGKKVAATVGASSAVSGSGGGDDGGGSNTMLIVVIVLIVAAAIGGFFLWKRTQASPAMAGGAPMMGGMPPSPPMGGAPMSATGTMPAPSAPLPPAPSGPPAAEPSAPPTAPSPTASASPGPAAGPQWDAQRNAYIQWDQAGNRWMQYDESTSAWKPIE
jgi:hypothetical protein